LRSQPTPTGAPFYNAISTSIWLTLMELVTNSA
jgi:hypothetical protein